MQQHILFNPTFYPIADLWIALTAIACRTERLRIGPMITPVARRRPWKLAKETDPRERARRLDEGLVTLVGLWSAEMFCYNGEQYLKENCIVR